MDERTEHDFTPAERAFFGVHLAALEREVQAINTAANLVAAQNGLDGQWLVKPDGSGMMKRDAGISSNDV